MPTLHKLAISRKTKSYGTFCLFFLDSMDLWHCQSNHLITFIEKWNLHILIHSLLQAKHLVIIQEKDDGVKVVLSYLLRQNVSASYIWSKCWSNFLCNWARLSQQPADLIFLTSTLLMGAPAIAITELWVLHFGLVCSLHGVVYARVKEHACSQRR